MSLKWILYLIGGGLVLVSWLADFNTQAIWMMGAVGVVLMVVGCLMDVADAWKKKQGKKDDEPKT